MTRTDNRSKAGPGMLAGGEARGGSRPGRLRRVFLFGVAGSLALFFAGFLAFIVLSPQRPAAQPSDADGIVVLTGGPARISEAINLLRKQNGKRLLITGVHPHTSERRLSQLAGGADLFACCVDIDRAAPDTRGNAAEAERWAARHQFHRLIIVTSDFHMARAMLEFSRRMPDRALVAWPVSVTSELTGPPGLARARVWLAEYVKFLYALVARGSTNSAA